MRKKLKVDFAPTNRQAKKQKMIQMIQITKLPLEQLMLMLNLDMKFAPKKNTPNTEVKFNCVIKHPPS